MLNSEGESYRVDISKEDFECLIFFGFLQKKRCLRESRVKFIVSHISYFFTTRMRYKMESRRIFFVC